MKFRDAAIAGLFAAVTAALCSSLLPLWEGFDEAFHYSYVETLSVERRIPVLGRTLVTAEVERSFDFAPVSHIVHRWVPRTTPFDRWFALPETERQQRRAALMALPVELRHASSERPNYEAHHPPLAYALMALVDSAASGLPLPRRVLLLRVCIAMASAALLFRASVRLSRTLGLQGGFQLAFLACVFETQMLWASIAHVSNDWLAIPIAAILIALLIEVGDQGRRSQAIWLGLALAAGLLTKAYYLAFVPIVAAVLWWKAPRRAALLSMGMCAVIAGPWYARNVALYGNVSGTHEAFDGIGPGAAFGAVTHVDWPAAIGFLARGALWTGNNSFTTFSRTTLNLELMLLAVAFVFYMVRMRSARMGERWALAAIGCFCLAIGYATCSAFAHTKGEVAAGSPWYSEILLAPVFAIAFAGMQRSGAAGRVLAVLMVLVNFWVCAATYVAKLFPLYGGFEPGRATIRALFDWWTQQQSAAAGQLTTLSLAPAPILYTLLSLLVVTLSVLTVVAIASVSRQSGARSTRPE